MHGRTRPLRSRKINYNGADIERANRSLTQTLEHGALRWLKTKFENCAMEAVPNVWEGDDGMMKHVPKFPMPPLIALPEQPGAAEPGTEESEKKPPAEGGPEDAEMSDEDDFDFEIPKPAEGEVVEPKYRKHAKERFFWTNLAKIYQKLDTINTSIIGARPKFLSEHDLVVKHTCQQLAKLYAQLEKIRGKLDVAEEEYKTNEYVNLFKVMPLNAKLKFKRSHNIEGRLPVNLKCIVRKHFALKGKVRDILYKYHENVLPFKDILSSTIVDLLNTTNEKDAEVLAFFGDLGEKANDSAENAMDVVKAEVKPLTDFADDGTDAEEYDDDELVDSEGNPKKKKKKSVGADGDAKLKNETEAPAIALSKEEIFWKSILELHRRIKNSVATLDKIDKVTMPALSRSKKSVGMSLCKHMLNIFKKIISFSRALVKLKAQLQAENYKDKKVFTAEDLANDGLDDVTSDNSMAVIEAFLAKLKKEYLRVRTEKRDILEKFGYNIEVDVENFPLDKNIQLVRVCAHSKTDININTLNEDHNQAATDENEAGQETAAGTENTDGGSAAVEMQTEDSAGGDEAADEASDESGAEDTLEPNKTVNSLSFFMKSLGPEAFAPTEQAPSEKVTEDFIEKERQHWNKIQKILRKVDRACKQLRTKSVNSYRGKRQMKLAVHSMRNKMKELFRSFELEKSESFRVGYCKQVTYQNLEFQTQNSTKLLVKSLDQVKDRLDNLHGLYKDTAKKMGLSHLYKL